MNTSENQDAASKPGDESSVAGARRQIILSDNRLDSRDLFTGNREITIAHGDDIYRLRLTAQNKLILTK
jgi:hemin uptake protein HemP